MIKPCDWRIVLQGIPGDAGLNYQYRNPNLFAIHQNINPLLLLQSSLRFGPFIILLPVNHISPQISENLYSTSTID